MKKISVIIALVILITAFSACKKEDNEETTTQPIVTQNTTVYSENSTLYEDTTSSNTENSTQMQTAAQTEQVTENQTNTTTEAAKPVTYISESPDNKYICMVADKYGSDKANLIAFIKTNTSTPGATVLEFSGAKDANGKLITTAEELRYVYDVLDSGSIKRASSDGLHNDGYNLITAKAAMMLGEKFFIPSIDTMREQRRYEDYF